MAYLLVKRGKFMTGHSYATGVGYSFTWAGDEHEARRFADNAPFLDFFTNITGAKRVPRPNNRRELRALARERMALLNDTPRTRGLDDRINRRSTVQRRPRQEQHDEHPTHSAHSAQYAQR
jgi:hypothetical protein